MDKETEVQFYWNLMQAVNTLRHGRAVRNDALYAELVDELEVFEMYAEMPALKRQAGLALAVIAGPEAMCAPGAA